MTDMDPAKKDRMVRFVQHLINQSRFAYDSGDKKGEKPFAKFVRFCDQIGNTYYTPDIQTQIQRVNGLVDEMNTEVPNSSPLADHMWNLAPSRVSQLEPDEDTQLRIMNIWEKDLEQDNSQQVLKKSDIPPEVLSFGR